MWIFDRVLMFWKWNRLFCYFISLYVSSIYFVYVDGIGGFCIRIFVGGFVVKVNVFKVFMIRFIYSNCGILEVEYYYWFLLWLSLSNIVKIII